MPRQTKKKTLPKGTSSRSVRLACKEAERTKHRRSNRGQDQTDAQLVTPKPKRVDIKFKVPVRKHAVRRRKALPISQADKIRKSFAEMFPEVDKAPTNSMAASGGDTSADFETPPGRKRPRPRVEVDLSNIEMMLMEAKSERAGDRKRLEENGAVLKSLQAEQTTMRVQQEESKSTLKKLEQKIAVVDELKASVAGFQMSLDGVQSRLGINEKKVDDLLRDFRSHCEGVNEGCRGMKTASHHMEEIALARRIAVLTSIPKITGETQIELRSRVDKFMKETIGMTDQDIASVMMQQCHRQLMYGREPKDDGVEVVFASEQKKDHFFRIARRNMTYGTGHRVRLCIPKCLAAKNRKLGDIAANCRSIGLHAMVRYTQNDEVLAIFVRKDNQDEWRHITQFRVKYPEYNMPDYKITHGIE